ncbi:MAG: M23 family metallopeptidase [Actinobacteria bacterium]|nr:M23 family metallopeptidase [Actinomycetota bacterium]
MFEARRSRILSRAFALATLTAACIVVLAPAPPAQAAGWSWPVNGEVLTPYRNGSNPYAAGQHRGIDIAAPVGTPVRAAAAGTVDFAGRLPDGGNCVTVATADGRYQISYLHLSSIAVKRGGRTRAGSSLGTVGLTGKRSVTAAHLHLSVRLAASGSYVDPLPLLGPRPVADAPGQTDAPAAKPLAAQPPAAQQQPAAGDDARVKDRARERSATQEPADARSRSRSRSGTRTSRPRHTAADQVHAPPPGDTVAAAPAHAAAGSAREGHASRGRVAPPPLPATDPRRQRLTAGTVNGEDVQMSSYEHGVPAATAGSGGIPWSLIALGGGSCLAIALLWARRRQAGTGPLNDDTHPIVERPAKPPAPAEQPATPSLRVIAR